MQILDLNYNINQHNGQVMVIFSLFKSYVSLLLRASSKNVKFVLNYNDANILFGHNWTFRLTQ